MGLLESDSDKGDPRLIKATHAEAWRQGATQNPGDGESNGSPPEHRRGTGTTDGGCPLATAFQDLPMRSAPLLATLSASMPGHAAVLVAQRSQRQFTTLTELRKIGCPRFSITPSRQDLMWRR